LHVERDRFDQILLEHAQGLGAKIFHEVSVTEVQSFEAYNLVEYVDVTGKPKTTLKATYVIDAIGQQLVLAKKNQWIEYDQKYKFQSFWAYYDHTSYLNASCQIKPFDERFTDPPMTLISSTGDWGWIWKIMLRDKVSIGAIIPQEHLGRFKAYGSGLKDRFTNYLADAPLISTMIAGSTLISDVMSVKDYTYRSRHFAFDQCYLIGDAVAFFDPINSEGITMAMYSGYLAAWAIAGSIIKPQRKLFYRDSYIRNMKTRLTLFYLLTYPEKNIPEELLLSIRESILQQSNTENHLTFSQLTLTNRGRGFDDILKQYGMNMDQVIRNVELPGEFG
jgi:halogenation protein CepH